MRLKSLAVAVLFPAAIFEIPFIANSLPPAVLANWAPELRAYYMSLLVALYEKYPALEQLFLTLSLPQPTISALKRYARSVEILQTYLSDGAQLPPSARSTPLSAATSSSGIAALLSNSPQDALFFSHPRSLPIQT